MGRESLLSGRAGRSLEPRPLPGPTLLRSLGRPLPTYSWSGAWGRVLYLDDSEGSEADLGYDDRRGPRLQWQQGEEPKGQPRPRRQEGSLQLRQWQGAAKPG